MAKPYQTIILYITTLYLLSIIQTAQSQPPKECPKGDFVVQGQVYCDVCRAHFVTKLSTFLKGATVRLECRNRETDTALTFSGEATTDESGTYHITVNGDFEDDICEVKLVKSPDPQCAEISTTRDAKDAARVSLTSNSGISSNVRMANAIGFMKKEAPADCKPLLEELGITPENK